MKVCEFCGTEIYTRDGDNMKHILQKNHSDCVGAVVAMLMGDPAYHIRYEDEVKPLRKVGMRVRQRRWLSAIEQVAWIDLDAKCYRAKNKLQKRMAVGSSSSNPRFKLPPGRGVILIWEPKSAHIVAFENGMVYDPNEMCEMPAMAWHTEMKKHWDYFDVQPEPKPASLLSRS